MKHNIEKISELLAGSRKFSGDRLYYFEEVESTNTWLLAQNKTPRQTASQVDGKICLAEEQTAGKGRRGKSWIAPASSSVLISIGWGLQGNIPQGLSLISGLAVVQSLRELGVTEGKLKWPNDIVVAGKKLGGILVEVSRLDCVIGVGINVNIPPSFDKQINQPWIDLYSLGYQLDRDQLVAAIVLNHEQFLSQYILTGFAPFVDSWNSLHAHQNQVIEVASAGYDWSGSALGVDENGALLVECGGSIRRLSCGEVSIRAQNDGIENDYKMS